MTSRLLFDDEAVLLESLESEVLAESDAAWRQIHEILRQPLDAQVRMGWTLAPVQLERISERVFLLLGDVSKSRYREGDVLLVRPKHARRDEGLNMAILGEAPGGYRVKLSRGTFPEDTAVDGWIAEPTLLDLTRYYLDAIEACGQTRIGRERVLPLLLGREPLTVEARLYGEALDEAERLGLNERQSEAFATACACDLVAYIQGPPGCGKTRVLALAAASLARRGARVWISSLTHRAIDNALEAVARLAPDVDVAKICSEEKDPPDGVPLYGYFANCPLAAREGGYVIGATPFAAESQRLTGWACDTLFLEEASQVTLPLALMAMLKSERTVLFGDEHQLPPVQLSCSPLESVSRSVLARVPHENVRVNLRTTYRMHPDLLPWPSRTFYGGELRAHAKRTDDASRLLELPAGLPPGRALWLPTKSSVEGLVSPEEAERAASLCHQLRAAGVAPEDMAVLTPFRAQARRIRAHLNGLPVVCDTVERMQGQEREVVVLSLAITDADTLTRLSSFFFFPPRLNVAFTRARSKVLLLASTLLAEVPLHQEPASGWQATFRELLDSCTRAWP